MVLRNMLITNAFSLGMIQGSLAQANMEKVSSTVTREIILEDGGVQSAIGHADFATMVSGILGMEIPFNRVSTRFSVETSTRFIVAQYDGPRLPEGATTLPEGAAVVFWVVCLDVAISHENRRLN